MSAATLQVRPFPPDARMVKLEYPHGTTTITSIDGRAGPAFTPEQAARLALLKHHDEEGCRCVRVLWRKHFGCRWPEVPLAVAPGAA